MCTLWSAATAAALMAVMIPGAALAADGETNPVTPHGVVNPYTDAQMLYGLGPSVASAAHLLESPAAANTIGPVKALSQTWAFPGSGANWRAWSRDYGRWSFASVTTPYAWAPYDIGVQAGNAPINPPFGADGDAAVALTQIVASYRITPTDRITVSYGITAPTGSFQSPRRNNAAYNFWTFTPKVAYIRALPGSDSDSSTIVAVGMFSRKTNAIYQNSAVGRIETLVMRQNASGWGFGGVAAAIEHYTIDPTAQTYGMPNTGNFDGVGIGVGPQINWNTKWRGGNIEFRYRWIYEFNGPGGRPIQPMLLSATVHL